MGNIFERIYHHKWFPRVFFKKNDGGEGSGVTGFMLIEWKPVFSIGLLHFKVGTRPACHEHAFNALTWWLSGLVVEQEFHGDSKVFRLSLVPKYTPRHLCHRVNAIYPTWALTFRGPWKNKWREFRQDKTGWWRAHTLTHGRKEIEINDPRGWTD